MKVPMLECMHIPPIDGALEQLRSPKFQSVLQKSNASRAKNAHTLKCHCGSDDVWVCLSEGCLALGCGRMQKEHALQHFKATGHAVCIHPHTTRIWCYACDDELLDEQSAKLVDLRKAVRPAEKVSSAPSERYGVTGLSNLGNTCFMNSALQCLAHTPSLQRHFRKIEIRGKNYYAHRKLVAGFTNWFMKDWKSSASSHSPEDILRTVQQLNPMFQGYAQHDAQEFLRFVLDSMHDTLKTQVPVDVQKYVRTQFDCDCTGVRGGSSSSADDATKERPVARRVEKDADAVDMWSVIKHTFGARIVSNVTCLNCLEVSRTIDPAYDISVPVPDARLRPDPDAAPESNQKSNFMMQTVNSMRNWFVDKGVHLTDCMHKFCEAEVLTGRDQYLCEKCKTKNDCKKTILLLELPEVLCIHVKRFRYDSNAWFGSKNSKIVTFPLNDFDVREFLDPKSEETDSRYRLIGLVQHAGSMGSGHYIAYCRHFKSKKWYEFDDALVTLVSPGVVEKAEPYILFYQKVPSKELKLSRGPAKEDKRRFQKLMENGSLPDEIAANVCYISTEWYQRFQTSSVCGPIDNFIHVCPHQRFGVRDLKDAQPFIAISISVYQQLVKQYGGGPMIISIEHCEKCARHIRAYNERKRVEYELVTRYDTKNLGAGNCWYLVDAVWVEKWKKYIDGGSEINRYRDIIELGKICSDRLCSGPPAYRPKPSLRLRNHYIGINSTVWEIFVHVHGLASPPIARVDLDIYSRAASPRQKQGLPDLAGRNDISWQYVDECKGDVELYHKLYGHPTETQAEASSNPNVAATNESAPSSTSTE